MKSTEKKLANNLTTLFLAELADMYDAEHRIAKALPKMAKAAESEALREAALAHLEETKGHVSKIEEVFALFGTKAKGKTCKATVGLLEEADEIAAEFKGTPSNDAALISAMQKVEHYEMASYGCLRTWAALLGSSRAAELLSTILEEEAATDQKLSKLAESYCNDFAMEEADGGDPAKKTATKTAAAKKKASV